MKNKQKSKQTNKQKLKFSISTTRLPATSQSWFQNIFWNHDWTIFLLRNLQNIRYKQTSKKTNKQKLKTSISTPRFGAAPHQSTSFVLSILWWSPSSFAKLESSQVHKMKKALLLTTRSEKTTFQEPKVSFCVVLPKMRAGNQRLFGTFPKIHPLWCVPSLRNTALCDPFLLF